MSSPSLPKDDRATIDRELSESQTKYATLHAEHQHLTARIAQEEEAHNTRMKALNARVNIVTDQKAAAGEKVVALMGRFYAQLKESTDARTVWFADFKILGSKEAAVDARKDDLRVEISRWEAKKARIEAEWEEVTAEGRPLVSTGAKVMEDGRELQKERERLSAVDAELGEDFVN